VPAMLGLAIVIFVLVLALFGPAARALSGG
jgi:hypothetical protein